MYEQNTKEDAAKTEKEGWLFVGLFVLIGLWSCARSLQINQQTRTTSRCKLQSEYGNSSSAWYMDGWGGFQKELYQGEIKRGGTHQPLYSTWVWGFMLRQDAGGQYLSDKEIPWKRRRQLGMAVAGYIPTASFLTKIGKMQSAGCQLCKIAREARGESTEGLADETHDHGTSTVQAAKEWQRQLRLPTTPSGGTYMIACMLHKSQVASSILSRLTKKVTWACCGDEKSFKESVTRKSWRRRHRI